MLELAPTPTPLSPEVPELCGELEEAGDHGLSYEDDDAQKQENLLEIMQN